MSFDQDNYLIHYGVKGMKWGVRRDIKKRSRTAARLEVLSNKNKKKINKAEKSIAKKKSDIETYKNFDTEKVKRQISKKQSDLKTLRKVGKLFDSYRDSLVKDLPEKDINQGRRYVKALDIASWPITIIPVIGRGISAGIDARYVDTTMEATRYYRNRNR